MPKSVISNKVNTSTSPQTSKLSRPKAILCDMDGVLVDSEVLHWESVLLTLQQCLQQSTPPHLPLRTGWDDQQLWQEMIHSYQLDYTVTNCVDIRKNIANHLLATRGVDVMNGVRSTLDSIRQHYPAIKLAVVSASLKEHMRFSLDALDGVFDLLISGFDDCTHNKPSPIPYLTASQRLDVNIEECWILEDSNPGLQAALSSQAQVFAVHAQESQLELRQKCVADLKNFADILSYLETSD